MEDGFADFITHCRKSLFRVERVYDGWRNCVVHRLAPGGCPMSAFLPSLTAVAALHRLTYAHVCRIWTQSFSFLRSPREVAHPCR